MQRELEYLVCKYTYSERYLGTSEYISVLFTQQIPSSTAQAVWNEVKHINILMSQTNSQQTGALWA